YTLALCDVRLQYVRQIKWSNFIGSILTGTSGIVFAYISPRNWIFHGLFITGLSIVFYSGVLLLIAIFPTKNFPQKERGSKNPTLLGINLEQINLALVTVAILVSAVIGAMAGANFGNGFKSFLAEAVVREEHDLFERMIVSHLHIMVALLDAVVMLIVYRYTKLEGSWFKTGMVLTIPGTIIVSSGAWLVITGWERSHQVINVGAVFFLSAALILALSGWKKTSKEILGSSYEQSTWLERAKAVLTDPVKFGLYFQFIFVNLVVTFPGILVAINLRTHKFSIGPFITNAFRSAEYIDVEYAFNVGHWHVLATLTALIIFLITIDYYDIKGKFRTFMGWTITLGSIVAFSFATLYMLRDPSDQGTIWFILIDIGIVIIFAGLFAFVIHQILEFVKKPVEIKNPNNQN
ncbi:MAG: hypothetical protein ACXAC7_24480, partial [Candidatus Hodarchaeales archaeon]